MLHENTVWTKEAPIGSSGKSSALWELYSLIHPSFCSFYFWLTITASLFERPSIPEEAVHLTIMSKKKVDSSDNEKSEASNADNVDWGTISGFLVFLEL